MRELYPLVEPYAVHHLQAGGGHCLYVEECGNPVGIPVVFLHGGPGSGCKAYHRSFFNPAKYRAILFDQRGSGRSTPHGLLENNTTGHLLADLDLIRNYLNIQHWLLFGGSWGATLALLYAQGHPERVSGLVLRGSFLARQKDLDWYVKDGANRIYPERWAELMDVLHSQEVDDLSLAIHAVLNGSDELARRRIAKAWSVWGGQVALGEAYVQTESDAHVSGELLQQARLELHYAVNRYFLEEGQILRDCHLISAIPAIIIHGRRDLVCPLEAAFSLHRHLPQAQLRILPDAGHIIGGPDMIDAMVVAADEMAERLKE